jgi:CRP-like cAMP-binding protein
MTNNVQTLAMLRAAAWARGLAPEQLERVERETQDRFFAAGEIVCHKWSMATHWIGVVEGMVKVDVLAADGRSTTLSGISNGGWLGEGSVLKGELRPYGVVALRDSRVALMPSQTFHELRGSSLTFCHFMIDQLNARLGQFIALAESNRMHDVRSRVASCLAELFNPQLNPRTGPVLQISQEEIGRLAGISRQIAHRALHELEDAGLLQIRYGSIDVLDLDGLRLCARAHAA